MLVAELLAVDGAALVFQGSSGIARAVALDPMDGDPGSRPSATTSEIVAYNGTFYGCISGSTPAFVALN